MEDNSGQPQTYCQQSFPYIGGNQELGSSYKLRLTGGNFENAVNPLIIDTDAWVQINGSRLGAYAFNIRPFAYNGAPYGQLSGSNYPYGNSYQFATSARATGRWDNDYFLPHAAYGLAAYGSSSTVFNSVLTSSELATDFCGYEPCPWTTPNLSPTSTRWSAATSGARHLPADRVPYGVQVSRLEYRRRNAA